MSEITQKETRFTSKDLFDETADKEYRLAEYGRLVSEIEMRVNLVHNFLIRCLP